MVEGTFLTFTIGSIGSDLIIMPYYSQVTEQTAADLKQYLALTLLYWYISVGLPLAEINGFCSQQ